MTNVPCTVTKADTVTVPGHRGHKNAHLNYSQQELAQVLRNYILLSHQKFPIRSIKVVIRR